MGAHEIGMLFGVVPTHVISLNYRDVEVNPDQCGGGPNGADCSTKPTIGGSLMSFCGECPRHGGSYRSAKPLTIFHPYQAEKIQEHYADRKQTLPPISRQKLRTFIPAEAKECAGEGETCFCKGVVYFGPTIKSDNPLIFGVEHVTDSVRCSSGPDEAFADVFHGKSKSCYCHEGADLYDITYTPADVEFTNGGIGECVVECSGPTCWDEYDNHGPLGYFTITGQPEWKCKQECLDRDECNAYNFKNGNCRLFQRQPFGTSNNELFSESTCWVRPTSEDARYLTPSWQEGEIIVSTEKTNDESVTETNDELVTELGYQYVMLENGEVCPNEASLIDNEDECNHAIYEVGLVTKADSWVDDFVKAELKRPAGCSFNFEKGNVNFNTNVDNGVGLGESTVAPICKFFNEVSEEADEGSAKCEFVPYRVHPSKWSMIPDCFHFDVKFMTPNTICRANFAHNGVAFVINNLENSATDVFRYKCTE